MSLLTDLRGAATRGELIAYFQPQIEVASGRIVGAEALCRWQHPDLGLIPPNDFIPLAEESGTIHEIGAFMINESCDFAASFEAGGFEIAVNVSAVQLAQGEFSSQLTETYERHGVKAEHLTIELTESRPVMNIPDAVTQLENLRSLGIGVSIDDFGRGHSSVNQLDALPFSELKIDQSLIREDTDETWSRVAALVALARHKGMRIVAEGIETHDQYERVRSAGCDRAQGYFLGLPMPRKEFIAHALANARTPLPWLAAPVRRALAAIGTRNLEELAGRHRHEISALHGIGPKTIARLTAALESAGLTFLDSPA